MNLTMPRMNTKTQSTGITGTIDDLKRSLAQEVDHIAQLAAQLGRELATGAAKVTQDAGTQAAVVARDLGSTATKAGQDVGAQAAAVARDVPVTAGTLAQQAARSAAQLGRDLRTVRITRQPAASQQRPDLMPGVALLGGFASGIALMYFFDPAEGRRRRGLLRDQVARWTRIGRQTATSKAGELRNRTIDLAQEAKKAVAGVVPQESNLGELVGETNAHAGSNGAFNGYGHDADHGEGDQTTDQQTHQPVNSEVG